jgi:GNAT superfamily N-acetyltransferase
MPWLPILHTVEEDVAHFRGRLETEEVYVFDDAGQVAGFAVLNGSELDGFYVAPEHQRRGVGAALFRRVQEQRPERFGLWVFRDNDRARRFYESHGARCLYETDGANNEERVADTRYECLASGERKREAGRAALALAQLLGAVDEHLDARGLEPPSRLTVVLGDQRHPRREREGIRTERLELLVRHLDDFDPELAKQLREAHRQEPRVGEDEVVREWADQREQMETGRRAVMVRYVEDEHLDAEQPLERPDPV